ncbi:MAG TPA: ATP-binding protein [Symbiobacteriaceae bacterium]|jgi:two-component system sensor histidine kinase ComP|nr:ATP-binding protein [Symbiobacteriaceae bacterium]
MINMLSEKGTTERLELSRTLHDMVLQDLLLLRQDLVRSHTAGCGGREVEQAIEVLTEIVARVRSICRDLRPNTGHFGLTSDLNALISDIRRFPDAPTIRTQIDLSQAQLGPVYSSLILRVIREALINVIKHAKAQTATVSLTVSRDKGLCIQVTDDGAGFMVPINLRTFEQTNHFGLINILEQVRLRGGEMQVDSLPGCGTTLTIAIPLVSS